MFMSVKETVMTDSGSEAAIRQIIDERANAVRRGDVEAMSADVADDVVIFDVVNPLRQLGKVASRARAPEWVTSYDGAIGWESRDVEVFADGNVAFSHAFSHVTGKLKAGDEIDMWFRTTLGFRRVGGRWLIVHDHGSSPFDPRTGDASLSLKPQRGSDYDR
jgi:ketosteroid isomerase-like protein